MDKNVIDKLRYVKMKLMEYEDSILFANFNEGKDNKKIFDELNLSEYQEFIKFSNGARFGSVDLWSLDDIPRNQFYISEYSNIWTCVGQILYEPIVIDKKNAYIYLFDINTNYVSDKIKFGEFNNFLNEFVLGEQYSRIIPDADSDDWYLFLKKIGVVG